MKPLQTPDNSQTISDAPMNAPFSQPTPRSAGIPIVMHDDNSHPVKVFVAFEDEGVPRPVVVGINRVAPGKLHVAQPGRLRETISRTCPQINC
jgi:hypothetical protein